MQFEGSLSSVIELPGNSPLKDNALSFSGWVKTSSSTSMSSYILFTRNTSSSLSTNTEAFALCLNAASGGKKFRAIKGTATQTYWIDNTSLLSNNTWYHICFTLDPSAIKIYLNGVLEGTVAAVGNIQYQTGKAVVLGSSNEFANPRPFDGTIDNLRFYNRVLNASEVMAIYLNDPPCLPALASPTANFFEGSGCLNQESYLSDSSANNPDAWHWTFTGATLQNSFEQNPAITYTSLGTQTIQLIVSNDLGSDTLEKIITVHPLPNVQASISPTMVGSNHQTTITASGASSYTWTYQNTVMYGPILNFAFNGAGNRVMYLVGRDSLGCLGYDTLNIMVYLIEGLIKNTSWPDNIEVFPNPLQDMLYLKNNFSEQTLLKIFDAKGKLIWETKLGPGLKVELNVDTFSPGVYYLQYESANHLFSLRLVKPS